MNIGNERAEIVHSTGNSFAPQLVALDSSKIRQKPDWRFPYFFWIKGSDEFSSTLGNTIYLAKAATWNKWTLKERAANLLHESQHVMDYRLYGMFNFLLRYATSKGRLYLELRAYKIQVWWWIMVHEIPRGVSLHILKQNPRCQGIVEMLHEEYFVDTSEEFLWSWIEGAVKSVP